MKIFLVLVLCFGLVGCSTMLPGKIIALDDGSIMPVQIETSYGSGKMTALDPKSGENFEGTYTGVTESAFSSSSGMFGETNFNSNTFTTSNRAYAKAVLVGDKGRVLNINMAIQAGWRPIGFGEVEDNKGRKYSLQF